MPPPAVPPQLPEVPATDLPRVRAPLSTYRRPQRTDFVTPAGGPFFAKQDKALNTIDLKMAHDLKLRGYRVKVAVVDEGVRSDHPLLNVEKKYGGDYMADGTRTYPDPKRQGRHGTSVALVLAGQDTDTYRGGVAPNADLYSANIGTRAGHVSDEAAFHAWNDLLGHGIKIFNNSFATEGPEGEQRVKEDRNEYHSAANKQNTYIGRLDRLVRDGALLIFAAGNGRPSGRAYSEVGSVGRTPRVEPHLQRGLIVVTAVDENGRLETWANRCGQAQQWCLAAPSTAYLPGLDKDNPDSIHVEQGTSLSAPLVTGAAVLVQDRFRWMDNDNLRTTLLTTAQDKGPYGVDPQYGWGVLDVGRAVQGPAQFAFGDFVARVTDTSTFGNDISGAGGLVVDGPGALVLAGANTYAGRTTIKRGTLDVFGSVTSAVTVEPGGTLTGIGTVGTVTNQGTVVNKEAGLHVKGDYSQTAQGLLVTDIGSLLDVSGRASLAGRLHVDDIRPGYVGGDGKSVPVIKAGAVSGVFATLTRSPGLLLNARLDYQPQAVYLTMRRAERVHAAAQRGADDGRRASVLAVAERLDAAMRELDALPESQRDAAAPAAAIGRIQRVQSRKVLQDNLYSLAGATYANAAAVNTLEQNRWMDRLENHLAQAGGERVAAIAEYRHGQLRWRPDGLQGRQRGNGIMLGLAREVSAGLSLAAALTHSRTHWDESSGAPARDNAAMTTPGVLLGARRAWEDGWFVQGALGYSRYRNQATRHISLGDAGHTVGATARGHVWQADAGLGRQWTLAPGHTLAPRAGLQLTHLRQQGFSESGAQGLGLRARALTRTVPTLWAQLQSRHAFMLGATPMTAQLQLGVWHDLRARRYAASGGFAGLAQDQGASGYWPVPRTRVQGALGLRAEFAPGLALGLGYTGQLATHWVDHQLSASLTYRY
ncbi:autotransporter subtilisin-like protease [Bordetella bronchiseptica MO149]|uniref:serine protease autotransporter SphB1 n=1 Tax=Bordetella bronchiseptica TaxID=518 RepID=UPI00028AB28C|nr:serine protease autotransporter SphB1 [Bordetella bronchiseptica]CCJ57160.1 autotransporter subtilisin-like protease [Bordetella bronchiseptica MO149]